MSDLIPMPPEMICLVEIGYEAFEIEVVEGYIPRGSFVTFRIRGEDLNGAIGKIDTLVSFNIIRREHVDDSKYGEPTERIVLERRYVIRKVENRIRTTSY